jgi:predicted O-methyltransferase YrrM
MRNKILPYMTNDEIVDLVSYLNREIEMLEIGGGNSTIFLSKLVKRLVTIEHNLEWSKTIENEIKNFNVDWSLHVVEPNWKQTHPFQPAEQGQFDNYVKFISTLDDNQFDVILVDGRDRVRCVLQSIPKLKKDGVILIHDFWNREKYHVLLENNELELIVDTNSYGNNPNNTLVAFKKKI